MTALSNVPSEARLVFHRAMTTPDPHDHDGIADTGMFRAFVAQPQPEDEPRSGLQKLWVWPGLLVPAIVSIAIIVVLIIVLTS